MSRKDDQASGAAPDAQANDSVYDFLYHDVRRVGSFLAQFDAAGLLTAVTQSESVNKGTKRGWRAIVGGSVPGVPQLGNAEVGVEVTPSESGAESSERAYDPLWTNALTLLDYLSERDLIERDLNRARIGQFVLTSGRLRVIDFRLLQGAWDKPAISYLVRAGAAQKTQESALSTAGCAH